MKAFITGSRAYGTATETSDLDLCVLMDQDTMDALIKVFGWPIKAGELNIIPCTSEDEMLAWRAAKVECVAYKDSVSPLTKSGAIAIHEKWRSRYGIEERFTGSGVESEEDRDEIRSAKQEARERKYDLDPYFDKNGRYR